MDNTYEKFLFSSNITVVFFLLEWSFPPKWLFRMAFSLLYIFTNYRLFAGEQTWGWRRSGGHSPWATNRNTRKRTNNQTNTQTFINLCTVQHSVSCDTSWFGIACFSARLGCAHLCTLSRKDSIIGRQIHGAIPEKKTKLLGIILTLFLRYWHLLMKLYEKVVSKFWV